MPSKVNVRRVRNAARRAARFGSRRSGGDERPAFSQQAFGVVAIVGIIGFVACSTQLYQVVSSEQGLEFGGVRFRLRGRAEADVPSLKDSISKGAPPLPSLNPPASLIGEVPLANVPQAPPFDRPSNLFDTPSHRNLADRWSNGDSSTTLGWLDSQAATNALASPPSPQPVAEAPAVSEAAQDAAYMPKEACTWHTWPHVYLGELLDHGDKGVSLDEAKSLCMNDGPACAGVTCQQASPTDCTPRRGVPYLAESPSGEESHVKECPQLPREPQQQQQAAPLGLDEKARGSPLEALSEDPVPELDYSKWQLHPPGTREPLGPGKAVIVVIAHDKTDCLTRCLDSIASQHQEDLSAFALAVSLDLPGAFPKMEAVVDTFTKKHKSKVDIWHKPLEQLKSVVSKIGAHFRFALRSAFTDHQFEYGLFIENDLTLAPDALWYFRATAWLLDEDPSLWCVSSWNDNGFKGVALDEKRLFRTDYFPGLGWMIRRETWNLIHEIWPKFPTTGWDHWIRHGSGLRPRECIIPEVPRAHHFDEKGTNVKAGSRIARLLAKMTVSKLQRNELGDLSYLLLDRYEEQMRETIREAEMFSRKDDLQLSQASRTYILPYTREEYKGIAGKLHIYTSQPRSAHRGIVITRHPVTLARILLVDRRKAAGILPPEMQWHPHPRRKVGAAGRGQSCDDYCRSSNMVCMEQELEYINHCSLLKAHFPCESGCGHQVGNEIPAYVHDAKVETAHQCIVTDEAIPKCKAQHRSTARLCACVPNG